MIWWLNGIHHFVIMWKRNETLKLPSSLSSFVVDTITFDHPVLGFVSSPILWFVLGHDLVYPTRYSSSSLSFDHWASFDLCSFLSSLDFVHLHIVWCCVVFYSIISNQYIFIDISVVDHKYHLRFICRLLQFIWCIFFERAYLAILSKPINIYWPIHTMVRYMHPITHARQRPILDSLFKNEATLRLKTQEGGVPLLTVMMKARAFAI